LLELLFLKGAESANRSEVNMKNAPVQFLCFDIGGLSSTVQFVLCSIGVFVFYLLYGYFQELIFTLEEFKPYGWYLTFIQFCFYAIFGFCETTLRRDTTRKIPLRTYWILSLLTVGTMGFSNASLGHLNYPTQVIFKCCKLIPVLVGSVLIQGKKYRLLDYLAALIMCLGLIWFTLADTQVSPVFDTIGLAMISSALLCDAIIGNVQEQAMRMHKASNAEIVLYSYAIGIGYIFFYLIISGELLPAYNVSSKHVMETYGYGFIFSLTGYVGIQIVLQLVRTSGAFAAVTVTTCRKAVTIILSFLIFSKPFTFQYVYSGLLVVFGIYINLFSKKNPEFSFRKFSKQLYSKYRVQQRKFIVEV
ncbi:unnamed protein product, partial [Allacma fusca]